jgi:hypothetical protein
MMPQLIIGCPFDCSVMRSKLCHLPLQKDERLDNNLLKILQCRRMRIINLMGNFNKPQALPFETQCQKDEIIFFHTGPDAFLRYPIPNHGR